MGTLKLFIDGSVNPQTGVGYGAYLLVPDGEIIVDSLKNQIKIKAFEKTTSTKLELEILLWALNDIQPFDGKIAIYTDSQNIIGLMGRRIRFEKNDYRSKNNRQLTNYKLYQEFFKIIDRLNCEFIKVKGHKHSDQKDEIDRLFTLIDRATRKALRLNT
jgi:ribonuclease HI